MAIRVLITGFDLILAVWLCAWAVGWVFAASTLLWQMRGREIIRVVAGDLEVIYRGFGFGKSWLYRGSEVHDLTSSPAPALFDRFHFNSPVLMAQRWGSIKFSHGARTIYAAAGLDEAEGRLIVEFLTSRLPRSATAA